MAVVFDHVKFNAKNKREIVPIPCNIKRRMLGSKKYKKQRDE